MNYIKGSLFTLADTLSRSTLNNNRSEIDNAKINSHLIELNYLISDFKLKQFKDETLSDKNL